MSESLAAAAGPVERGDAVQTFILHHVADSQEWSLPFLHVQLPGALTLHGLMLIIGSLVLLLLLGVLYRRNQVVPTGWSNLLELFVIFVRDQIAVPSLGTHDGRKMTPLLCTFFFFILCLNLLGLVPAFAAATSNVSVTGALALVTLAFMVGGSIVRNGVGGFVRCFVPPGIPWPVLILLTPIEFLGLFIKAFALTIRLFANMLAGHIVIFSLVGLVVTFGWWALPSIALAVAVYLLEVFICILQAFIFTLLSAIFMGLMYHPAH